MNLKFKTTDHREPKINIEIHVLMYNPSKTLNKRADFGL